jgi:hypothetical protein
MKSLKSLFDHAASANRENVFSTSFSTYSVCPTKDEDLVLAYFAEAEPNETHFDVMKVIPSALFEACSEYEATDEEIVRVSEYVREMFEDVATCHRDNA